jgi:hypothetical protein
MDENGIVDLDDKCNTSVQDFVVDDSISMFDTN